MKTRKECTRKKSCSGRWPLYALITLLAGISLFSGCKIAAKLHEYRQSAETYSTIAEEYVKAAVPASYSETDAGAEHGAAEWEDAEQKTEFPLEIDFASLIKENREIVAWIYNPDTVLSYPVCHTDNNDKYLHMLVDGTYNYGGTIFLDAACSGLFSSGNSILYGHNMQDGSMFRSIIGYKTQEYYDEHPVMYLATPAADYRCEIFSCFVTQSMTEAYTVNFRDQASYGQWLAEMKNRSVINTDTVPETAYNTLMLSTCSYEYDGARTVVMAMLVPC